MLTMAKPIQDYIYAKANIVSDGIGLLQGLTTSFQQSWGQIKKDNHMKEWVGLRVKYNEAYLDFFSRCLKLRNLSIFQAIPCIDNDLKHCYTMGLPPQFTSIQEHAHDLPEPRKSASIHKLPALAQDQIDNKTSVCDLHRSNGGVGAMIPTLNPATTKTITTSKTTPNLIYLLMKNIFYAHPMAAPKHHQTAIVSSKDRYMD